VSNLNPLSNAVSLDDLLKANRQQFDRIFAAQMQNPGRAHAPPPAETAPMLLDREVELKAPDGDVYQMLNRRFGSRWASEVIEQRIEHNTATVLCKLTVDGGSKMQFGTAPVEANEDAALRRATEAALARCAAMFGVQTPSSPALQQSTSTLPARGPEIARDKPEPGRPAPAQSRPLDTITLDLIENALRNARHEMDAVLFRSAMSPVIREQHDEFPMITDAKGRMIVGQFGSYIANMLAERDFDLQAGDVILQSDPYRCGGAISHINDWMVLVPVFHDGDLVGFTSMFGHMMDVGGAVPGSMPTAATSIFGEGIRIPPIKLYQRGEINQSVVDLLMNNTRTPEMNYSDLMAIVAGCRAGEKRVIEICNRFGRETYKQACVAL
jgi:hypothetical protein